ncbi:SusC/RagA family TonB-linked outer membrane protein [Prolixibacteraceae bacterium JC049]|nr:SusC/RagA family TonB-linked outer membrane protein [Prolixibacteraceae bacterium JC049]
MKKKSIGEGIPWPGLQVQKLLNIMRLTVLLVLVSMFQVVAKSYSQTTKLDMNLRDATISEVFEEIKRKSDFTIFYKTDQVDVNQKVSIKVAESTVDKVLNSTLSETNLTYRIIDRHIVIFPKDKMTTKQDQQKVVRGVVTEPNGDPVVGASVIIKGTTRGVVTDIDGNYTLPLDGNSNVLVFSFMGMVSQEVEINGRQQINIVLETDNIGLEEVVAIGYGVQKKSDLTGAVASVKADKIQKVAVTNPGEALQGRLAGVSVTKLGGAPGAGVDIKVRGVGTVGSNAPLYIIDGLPGSLYFLNPNDIASIEVLKDGAAAAIYGSRAANGVVLITTKKGKTGGPKIDYQGFVSFVSPRKLYDVLDADGYVNVHRQMYENVGQALPGYLGNPGSHDTDWVDEVFQNAVLHNHSVSISGGAENAHYSLSGNLVDEGGTVLGSNFIKKALRAKTGITKGMLTVDGNISYTETKTEGYKLSLRETYHISPLIPIYDDTKKSGFGYAEGDLPSHNNPIGVDHFNSGNRQVQYFVANMSFQLKPFDWMLIKSNLGLTNSNEYEWSYRPPYMVNVKEEKKYPFVSEQRSNWRERIMENIIQLNHDFDKHSVSLLGGFTATKQTNKWTGANVEGKTVERFVEDGKIKENIIPGGFLDLGFKTLNAGEGGTYDAWGSNYTYTRSSVLGRLNYAYDNKYLAQVTFRRDGSSKFGADSRYGNFPSASVGWRMSEESFVKNLNLFDNLKLRGSWGRLGNEVTLGYYDHQALISTQNGYWGGYSKGNGENPWPGSIAPDLENKDLSWETTESINIGIDFGFLGNRLTGALNYYQSNTSDMLVVRRVPVSAGVSNPTVNVGEIENRGFELELSYTGNAGELNYEITGTVSTLKNEVKKLANTDQILYGAGLKFGSSHYATQTRVGNEIGAFYLYQADGIFQNQAEIDAHVSSDGTKVQPGASPGDMRFKDMNDDGKLDEDDIVYSGAGIPKMEYSLNLNASYKNFDLSVYLQGVSGNKIYNGNRFELEGMDAGRNFLASTENAWRPDNTNTNIPRAALGDPNRNNRESTRFLEDGAYLRVKNIQLGYTLPKQLLSKMKFDNLRVYVSGQNLITLTDYSGLDPEVGQSSVLNTGIDRTIYPISKSIVFGVQLNF